MKDVKKTSRRLIVHDLEQKDFLKQLSSLEENTMVLSKDNPIAQCTGCFGCWIKTPATCIMKDGYQDHGKNLCHIDEFILISRCTYGGFSPFVKNVLDRIAPPSLLPFFSVRNGEVHHTKRVKKQYRIIAHLYGDDITDEEKQTALKLVKANGINVVALESEVHFYQNYSDITEGKL